MAAAMSYSVLKMDSIRLTPTAGQMRRGEARLWPVSQGQAGLPLDTRQRQEGQTLAETQRDRMQLL